MRRIAGGWEPEEFAGGGAAAAETGVPSIMMAMLIRAGLPSRKAALAAIQSAKPSFTDSAGLREWLLGEDVEARTAKVDWPTADTSALWRRFRGEVTGASAPAWKILNYRRLLKLEDGQARPASGVYRVELDSATELAWIVSPDFQRIAPLRRSILDKTSALYRATFIDDDERAYVERLGPGKPDWDVEL